MMFPRGTWESFWFIRGWYLYLHDRETRASCSLQSAKRTHCSEFVVWVLEHKVRWKANAGDPWRRTTKLTRHFLRFINVTYLDVTLDRMTWRHDVDRTVAKALRKYVRTCSVFKSGLLSTNIELTLYIVLIRSVMTHAYPTWEYAEDAHLLKL
jgi:hypothetical protein